MIAFDLAMFRCDTRLVLMLNSGGYSLDALFECIVPDAVNVDEWQEYVLLLWSAMRGCGACE